MFSYRHAFHAGNFADVFKHVILIQLLRALLQKDKAFFVLDTHAGAGRYDLRSNQAQKVGEYREGIERLWSVSDLPPELVDYRELVKAFNADGRLNVYPGSPVIAQRMLRSQDRLVCCEPHPTEFPNLQAALRGAGGVTAASQDGYKALETYLPPKENRGLVFIDPSFELEGEFERLLGAVKLLQQRWRNGMLALWYPILHRAPSARFHESIGRLGVPKILCAELGIAPYDSPHGMHGCGMVLVNPPWQIDETLKRVLPVLLGVLGKEGSGQTRVEWLSG